MLERAINNLFGHNEWILFTFVVFILIQFVFSGIYFHLYKQNKNSFAFNADILRGQADFTLSEHQKLKAILAVLAEVQEVLEAGTAPDATDRFRVRLTLNSGFRCEMLYTLTGGAPGPISQISTFNIYDPSGVLILRTTPSGDEWYVMDRSSYVTNSDWRVAVERIINCTRAKEARYASRVESLSTAVPDVWTYWDFLYFSVVVQTTVGLGDVLPNSTLVRLVVASQVVIGYAIVVVALNMAFKPG